MRNFKLDKEIENVKRKLMAGEKEVEASISKEDLPEFQERLGRAMAKDITADLRKTLRGLK